MFLSEFSIKRPIATVVLIIALMAIGLLALSKLRVNQIPDVEQPVLTVGVTYPGASPETVEREVVNRIEKALQGISGIYQVRSTSSEGYGQIVLFFNLVQNSIELFPVISPTPNLLSFQPPKLNGSRGTGTPTLTPIIPALALSML